jgi:hypothetical protein
MKIVFIQLNNAKSNGLIKLLMIFRFLSRMQKNKRKLFATYVYRLVL